MGTRTFRRELDFAWLTNFFKGIKLTHYSKDIGKRLKFEDFKRKLEICIKGRNGPKDRSLFLSIF